MGHFAECSTRQRTPLPSAMVTALGKAGKMGARKTIFPALSSAMTMALGKDFLKKIQTLPSADKRALGKEFKKKSNFAECRPEGTRQRFFLKKNQTLPSAGQGALDKEFLEKK